MPSYVELQSPTGTEPLLRVALPDDVTRDIACRQDGGWIGALHDALRAHRPRGCDRFVEALDAELSATVLFAMPARSEGDPPVHVVRWADGEPERCDRPRARQRRPPEGSPLS